MDIPKLYKYRYFNEKLVSRDGFPDGEQIPQWHQVLYDGIIIPAAPETFNDPYDCDFLLEDGFLNSSAARSMLIELLAERCAITSEEKISIRNSDNLEKTLKEVLWKHFRARSRGLTKKLMETSISTIQRVKELLRVACFSEINDSILMWSHYADNHKGFCIEYDLSDWDCSDHLKPVQYVNERHYIRSNFADNLSPNAGREIMDAALFKSAEWSYEKEWRLVMSAVEIIKPKFKGTIPALFLEDFITAVYIGTKAEEKYCAKICEHYRKTDVKVYRMQMQTDCYKLRPVQIQ